MSRLEVFIVANIAAIAPIYRVVLAQGNTLRFVTELYTVLENCPVAGLMNACAHDLGKHAYLKRQFWLKALNGIGKIKLGIKRQM